MKPSTSVDMIRGHFKPKSKQSLTTRVPLGAVTGPIRVKNASGSDVISIDFIVLGDPTSPLPGTREED